MKAIKRVIHRTADGIKNDQAKGAQHQLLEELFSDYYYHRRKIYKMNFIRGLFFGLGSALGGTLLIAIIVWLLALLVNIPYVGDPVREAQESLTQ